MKNKGLIVLLIVVILALIGGLVFCGLKISKLNAIIEEYESKGTETVAETTTKEDTVEEKVTENTGLSIEQILSFDESQIKNLKDRQHVAKSTIDDCRYVRVHANRDMTKFVAYIDTYSARQIFNKELEYASYDITTQKPVSKVVCGTFGQAEGNEAYMFLYTDGTVDYFAAKDVLDGHVELKHFDVDNVLDIFNVSIGYEDGPGYLSSVLVKNDGTAYILSYGNGSLKLEEKKKKKIKY